MPPHGFLGGGVDHRSLDAVRRLVGVALQRALGVLSMANGVRPRKKLASTQVGLGKMYSNLT